MKRPEPEDPVAREVDRMRNRVVWSMAGWRETYRQEHSFRSWVYANVLSIVMTFVVPISLTEQMVIVVLGVLVLAAELINTAIERLTDLVTKEHHELAGQAKDAGSAGVAITAIAAGVAWGFAIFGIFA